jgi:hypothetical protein
MKGLLLRRGRTHFSSTIDHFHAALVAAVFARLSAIRDADL